MNLKKLLPKRTKESSKIDGGKVLIVGGGKGLYGAGILSALAATKCGAGYTHLITELASFPWVKFPDFIVHPLQISELKKKEDFVIGIGPGLGVNAFTHKLIAHLIQKKFEKVVVDADALSDLAKNNLVNIPATWILTPHEGELARLLKVTSASVKKDRAKYLQTAFEKFQCTIILKGSETLIISPESKKILKVKAQTTALAKAGTGDVLLGMITAFRAQGLSPLEACFLGCTLHGKAAHEFVKKGNDHLSMRPVDLIDLLPKTIYKARGTK
ncbi:MAG: NAD(P)H-hydrate dehydratase [Rhizobacter sp.]|nr:NAD(P)H-hydrate dehydratase [Bacteriovorax sp.]